MSTNKTSIALIDDHALFRVGLKSLLHDIEGFEVIGEFGDGEDFIQESSPEQYDIALMDLDMPKLNGMQTIEAMHQGKYTTKVIVLSSHKEEKFIVHLMELGAAGYLMKDAEPSELKDALISVRDMGYYFNDLVSQTMLKGLISKNRVNPSFSKTDELSEREMDVLNLICEEFTTAEIAEKLFISPRTVDGHRNHIMEKTGARNTAGIVAFAFKNGLVN